MDRYYEPSSFGNGLGIDASIEIGRIKNDRHPKFLINSSLKFKKGEKFMRIKFKSYEAAKTNPNAAGKTYSIYRVKGVALEGKMEGEDWTTQFFASAKDMATQVKDLNDGDVVDVQLKKNGNYYNPQSFTKVEGESAVPTTSGVAPVMAVNNSRLENLKVAVGIIGPKKKGDIAAEYIMQAAEIADLVQDYVDEAGVFQFPKGDDAGIPEAEKEDKADVSLI